MKTFVVILALAAVASADIGLGYHYGPQKPQTSYEPPAYSSASGSNIYNTGYSGQHSGSIYKGQSLNSGLNSYQTSSGLQNSYPSQVVTNTGYQGSGYQSGGGYQTGTGYQSGTGFGSGSGYQTVGNYDGASGSGGSQFLTSSGSLGTVGISNAPIQNGYQAVNQYHSSSQYQSSAANYQQQYYNQVQQQEPQIFKHFYVHAAPEEPEVVRPRQPVVLPAPQKHYKIIFIKTPAPAAGSTRFVPIQPQNEEKTIVYVLVKKPEDAEDVVLPQIEQKPPTKPEVYFIKYKGKEDSQAVINNIVNEYNSGKGSANVAAVTDTSGTLDSISDAKFTSQSASGSQSLSNAGAASLVSSGSYESQYETSGASAGQAVASGSSGSGYQSQSYGTSTVGYPTSTAAPVHVTASTGGYESNHAGSSVSTTASSVSGGYGQVNAVSSNQGIPHETYGPPKFRDYQ